MTGTTPTDLGLNLEENRKSLERQRASSALADRGATCVVAPAETSGVFPAGRSTWQRCNNSIED